MAGVKKPDGWAKNPIFERNGQKKGLNSLIGSFWVKNREKQHKNGSKKARRVVSDRFFIL
jgi:hypothetical protein